MKKLSFELLLISLLAALIQCKEKVDDQILKPKWKEGDLRRYEMRYSMLVKKGDDTIVHFDLEKNLQLEMIEKKQSSHIIEVSRPVPARIEINSIVDSLEKKYDWGLQFLEGLTEYMRPYKLKIAETGEVEEVVDLEDYYMDLLLSMTTVSDTLQLKDENHNALKRIIPEDPETLPIENLNQDLLKETSDFFDLYNIGNPAYGDVTQKMMVTIPGTGEER